MIYSRILNHLVFSYLIDGVNLILYINEVVDLGFIFDNKLYFHCQCSHIKNMLCNALKLKAFVKLICIGFKSSVSIIKSLN